MLGPQKRCLAVFLTGLLTILAGPVGAFRAPDEGAGPRLNPGGPGTSFVLRSAAPSPAADKRRVVAWKSFTDRHGPQWDVRWNETTGVASRITGRRIRTGLGPKAPDQAAVAWVRGFVDQNKSLLGVG